MMISPASTIGRTPIGRDVRRLPWLLLVLLVGVAAGPFRPTPKFEGETIPDPPRQKDPWTPPESKLPRFLNTATAALFESGMADPRGCDYRNVEIGDAGLVATRGFVLPERPDVAGRFAVSWAGIVYPAFKVGEPADLEADVRAMAKALEKGRQSGRDARPFVSGFNGWHSSIPPFVDENGSLTTEPPSSLALCMLLRLGRADLAEQLFEAGTVWTPEAPQPDLTNYGISFVSLASEWARLVDYRLLSAHERGDDAIALNAAQRLSAFQKAADAKAAAMGFRRSAPRSDDPGLVSYIGRFDYLPDLLADQERRAREAPRGPIPKPGGDPKARIAALIRDFDQIHVVQMASVGSANPARAPIVRDLIAEGEPAVEPLLDALESDHRLTRSVSGVRMSMAYGNQYVNPVTDAIIGALHGILKTSRFLENGDEDAARRTPEGRKRLARAIRAYWEKNRAVPLIERWYRNLRDDSAGADRWLEAAAGLTQPVDADQPPRVPSNIQTRQPDKDAPLKGEPLRDHRDPSVSELLARRVAEIARDNLSSACRLALMFDRWDEPSALPTLKALMTTCRERSDRSNGSSHSLDIARFTQIRVQAGDREALDEYAAWAQAMPPKAFADSRFDALKPLWSHPDHPAIAEAARVMFLDPESPWLPLVPRDRDRLVFHYRGPIASPLVCLPAFREALLAALEDRETAGTGRLREHGYFDYQMVSGQSGGGSFSRVPTAEDRPGVDVSFRACDVVAWTLSGLVGAPECQLYWDQARRDAAVTACADFLRRFGPRFSAEPPASENAPQHPRVHLRFPHLDRPATAEDVRMTRAIFSIADMGQARVVNLPSDFPIRARWTTLKAFPIYREAGNGQVHRDYLQDGWVWQAEEVLQDGAWERFYGFVGHATIARVPASEIEFPPLSINRPAALPDGLEAKLLRSNPPPRSEYATDEPIMVTLQLRNRQGLDRTIPTEFIRQAEDGKPALRSGIDLVLTRFQTTPRTTLSLHADNPEPMSARTAHFEPGDASRTLAPTETFEALTIDLHDWFADLGPGPYRFHLTFAADSGLGEGKTDDLFFTIRDPDDPAR